MSLELGEHAWIMPNTSILLAQTTHVVSLLLAYTNTRPGMQVGSMIRLGRHPHHDYHNRTVIEQIAFSCKDMQQASDWDFACLGLIPNCMST